MSKFIVLIIALVALCMACSMACHRVEQNKEEPDVIQKIEKQWAKEYDIYRLPKEASLGYLKV